MPIPFYNYTNYRNSYYSISTYYNTGRVTIGKTSYVSTSAARSTYYGPTMTYSYVSNKCTYSYDLFTSIWERRESARPIDGSWYTSSSSFVTYSYIDYTKKVFSYYDSTASTAISKNFEYKIGPIKNFSTETRYTIPNEILYHINNYLSKHNYCSKYNSDCRPYFHLTYTKTATVCTYYTSNSNTKYNYKQSTNFVITGELSCPSYAAYHCYESATTNYYTKTYSQSYHSMIYVREGSDQFSLSTTNITTTVINNINL